MTTGKPSPRRRARELALQGIYQWQLSGNSVSVIEQHLAEEQGMEGVDRELFNTLLRGAVNQAETLRAEISPHTDRPWRELSPVERSVLMLATFELIHQQDTPYRVVINEAIELAKAFGGAEGHKFVNGVLDKLAAKLRATEVQARQRAPKGRP